MNAEGSTALHWAAVNGKKEVQPQSWAPTWGMHWNGQLDKNRVGVTLDSVSSPFQMVEILMDYGANPAAVNK